MSSEQITQETVPVEKTETSIIIERKIDVCVGGTIVTLFVVIKRQ